MASNITETPAEMEINVGQVLSGRLPRLARFIPSWLIRRLERLICQDELNRLLHENAGLTGSDFCHGVLRSLDIRTSISNPEAMPPKDSPRVVFACNHPLGGLDGMALIYLVTRHFNHPVHFVVNDLLMAIKPLEPVFLPVNKFGRQSRESFRNIDAAFEGDDPILVFPAGLCSRLQKVEDADGKKGLAVRDLEWHNMFIKKCRRYGRDIIPLFFDGENSADFYRKARLRKRLHIPFNLEMTLLPREMIQSRGNHYTVTVGSRIPFGSLTGDANALAAEIRRKVYQLKQ